MRSIYLEVLPDGIEWDAWVGATIHDLGEDPLPYVPEDQWREFADAFISIPELARFGVPDDLGFDDWRDWARSAIVAVNGQAR